MANIEIETNDSVEDVKASLGNDGVEIEDTTEESESTEETPATEDGEEEEPESEEQGETETEEEEEGEEEPPKKEEKGKQEPKPQTKKAPTVVSRNRLNEVIAERNELRRKLEEAERKPAAKGKDTEDAEEPTTEITNYSGKPEPKLDDYLNDPKYDGDDRKAFAAFTKDYGAWNRAEATAEADLRRQEQEVARERAERVKPFSQRSAAYAKANPDYQKVVKDNPLVISALMEEFVYDSEVGPQVLEHLCLNEDEAERIKALKPRAQSLAMLELEEQFSGKTKASKEDAEEEPEEEEEPKKKKPLLKKEVSKAPLPPNRLKPGGPGPKSLEELAGPSDRTGIDIEFNPEYERVAKANRNR